MKIPHFQIVTAAFCFALTMTACGGGDDQAREAAAAQALETIQAPPVEQATPTNQSEQQNQQTNQPTPSTQPKDSRPKTGGTLNLNVSGGSTTNGGETCVAVSAKGFKSIVSVQYSIKWDPKVLKFKGLKGFGLPGLGAENFGKHIIDKGLLTHSWFDANVKGISKGDGETLYEICFDAVGTAGTKSSVQIIDAPTIIEIANVHSEFLTLDATPGMVLVK